MTSRKRYPQDPSFVGVSLGQQVKPTPNLKTIEAVANDKSSRLKSQSCKTYVLKFLLFKDQRLALKTLLNLGPTVMGFLCSPIVICQAGYFVQNKIGKRNDYFSYRFLICKVVLNVIF